jgi:uncharacterized protein YcbK (DUF882 family)
MIELRELLKIPEDHWENLQDLHAIVSQLREAYGKPLTISSGYRSLEDHLRIYKEKGITNKVDIPMKSKHLSGEACDLVCKDIKDLQKWIKDNEDFCGNIGLWFEDFGSTPTWVHCQIVAPKSGKRFFVP